MDILIPPRKVKVGTLSQTGTATTAFTFAHGMSSAPSHVAVTAKNTLSAALFATTWDSTNITITYMTAITGTLSLGWLATA